jgi:Tfp pilus assembly protein FimT
MILTIGTKKAKSNAFTLIELTLVTLLLLVLIGLSIPLFKNTFSDLALKNSSFDISKLINYAQEMAVLERKNFRITFDFQKGKYQLFEIDGSANPPVYKKVRGRFGRQFGLPQGASLTGSSNGIRFYPDGHCDELKLNVLIKDEGYSLAVKRFGNVVEVKEVKIEQ